MTVSTSNDTVTYKGSDGSQQEAKGVVILAGGGGGSGGGGDASAANQNAEIARLTTIRDTTGAVADAPYASADGSGSGSVASILKGLFVALKAQLPASLGQKTMAASLPVTLASDGVVGAQADTVATSDTGSFSLIALFKRSLGYLSTLATAAIKPTAGTDLSGTATTTSGGLSIPANANRKPGDVQGQNISTVNIGFNEFGGTAAIGTAGTYTVLPGASFAISTNRLVNFVAASGTAAVTMTSL